MALYKLDKDVDRVDELFDDFNQWPNSAGFDGHQDLQQSFELEVRGLIPSYCYGTLLRTGPQSSRLKAADGRELAAHHWFDGFSQVYKFDILPSTKGGDAVRVLYNSRSSSGYRNDGAPSPEETCTFGRFRDPCESFFAKVASSFSFLCNLDPKKPSTPNIGVSLLYHPMRADEGGLVEDSVVVPKLAATTDADGILFVDPVTLETQETANHYTLYDKRLTGPMTGTHYCTDPINGDLFNYNLDTRGTSIYRVFRVSAKTGETDILATITDAPSAYIHSFFLTENFVILCVWGAHFSWMGLKVLWTQNVVDSLEPLDLKKDCRWYVIDRTTRQRGVMACYTSSAFFSFHTVNAYEEESEHDGSEKSIVLDLAVYDDLSVLKQYYYENLRSSSTSAHTFAARSKSSRARLARFRLPNVPFEEADQRNFWTGAVLTTRQAESIWRMAPSLSLELPTIHPRAVTKKHRYIWGIANRGKSTFFDGIGKFDCQTQTTVFWECFAHTPSEPIFIPDPDAAENDEEAGVILTVVLDGPNERSYLLALDARTMKEIGRAETENAVVPFAFHGLHVPASRVLV